MAEVISTPKLDPTTVQNNPFLSLLQAEMERLQQEERRLLRARAAFDRRLQPQARPGREGGAA